jgi:uncharacterized protein YeaC (DUF1315 family)
MTYKDDTATAKQLEIFFSTLAATDHVQKAVTASGLSPRSVYYWRDKDPEFAQRWTDAREAYVDKLEAEAFRRAVEGTEKGVWHQGMQVGTEKQYSDSLLALMLKAKRKREYGDASKVELTGADGGAVKVEESPTAIGRKIAFALAVAMRAKEQEGAVIPDDGSDMA